MDAQKIIKELVGYGFTRKDARIAIDVFLNHSANVESAKQELISYDFCARDARGVLDLIKKSLTKDELKDILNTDMLCTKYICECGNMNNLSHVDFPDDGYYAVCPRCGKSKFVPESAFES